MTIKHLTRALMFALAMTLAAGSLFIAGAQTSHQNSNLGHRRVRSKSNSGTVPASMRKVGSAGVSNRRDKTSTLAEPQTDPTSRGCNRNSTGTSNTCYGASAGAAITTGIGNALFGADAGKVSTIGGNNAFFGLRAGLSNTEGNGNAFFGTGTGQTNTKGNTNAFFGYDTGRANTEGSDNAFFGTLAGQRSATGSQNAFFGTEAGPLNTTGSNNAFFGHLAGQLSNGDYNTSIGSDSGNQGGVTNATAIGAYALVTQSNSLVLGSIKGLSEAPEDTRVGIGTSAPKAKLHVEGGDVYIKTQNNGIILRATDGANCFRVTVNNAGTLKATAVTCP
jgi:hypothetical protein